MRLQGRQRNTGYHYLPAWKWILLFLMMISIAHNTYYYIEFYAEAPPSAFDLLMEEIDNKACLCYMLTYCFLLSFGDKRPFDYGNSCFEAEKKLTLSIGIVLGIMLVSNSLIVLIKQGTTFVPNIWYGLQELHLWGLSPAMAMAMGLCLLFLRFLFMGNLTILINGSHWNIPGTLAVMVISCIEGDSYLIFRNAHPFWIFPIEHTRLLTSYNAAIIEGTTRINYGISILYWALLIGVTAIAIHRQFKRRHLQQCETG